MIERDHPASQEDQKTIIRISQSRGTIRLVFDDESVLSLPVSVFSLLKLKEGSVFLPSSLAGLQKHAVALCFSKCCRSLEARFRTTAELSKWLRESAWPDAVIQETIKLLLDAGYLDDARYCEAYVARRQAQGYGGRRIRAELLQKGIPRELLDETSTASEDDGFPDDGLQKALRKAVSGKNLSNPRDFEKAMASLVRRGYSYREARNAVERVRSETEDD